VESTIRDQVAARNSLGDISERVQRLGKVRESAFTCEIELVSKPPLAGAEIAVCQHRIFFSYPSQAETML